MTAENSNRDKLLCLLSLFDEPQRVRDLRRLGESVGFRRIRSLNISDILSRSAPLAVNLAEGWKLTASGRQYLRSRGLGVIDELGSKPVLSLRSASDDLIDAQTRAYVREAIACHEHGLYRAAVIMSWIGAVSMLRVHIVDCHLSQFNEVAYRKFNNWKRAKTLNDLSQMSESEFLDRLTDISVIGIDTKKELRQCLDRRNSCSHPNELEVGQQTSAHHIEVLINNVFSRVCSVCQ